MGEGVPSLSTRDLSGGREEISKRGDSEGRETSPPLSASLA